MGRAGLHIDRAAAGAERPDETVLHLVGTVDEHADLSLLSRVEATSLVLDLAGVDRINSVGVREWIRAMKAIPDTVRVTWVRVSPAMVSQLSMIANFHGRARIRSFYAPYFCEACGWEGQILMDPATDLQRDRPTAPEHTCPECGAKAALDDLEEDYFGAVMQLSH